MKKVIILAVLLGIPVATWAADPSTSTSRSTSSMSSTSGSRSSDSVDQNARKMFGKYDTNGDGQVDLVDLNAVRNNFGAAAPAPLLRQDRRQIAVPKVTTPIVARVDAEPETAAVETRLTALRPTTALATDALFAQWNEDTSHRVGPFKARR